MKRKKETPNLAEEEGRIKGKEKKNRNNKNQKIQTIKQNNVILSNRCKTVNARLDIRPTITGPQY